MTITASPGRPGHVGRAVPEPKQRRISWPSVVAEQFLVGPRGRGSKLPIELAEIMQLTGAHGTDAVLAALQPAVEFHRRRAADIRSILAAGGAAPHPTAGRRGDDLDPAHRPDAAAVGVQGQHKRRRQLMATTTPRRWPRTWLTA